MALYDDAKLNTTNPLELRSPQNGSPYGPPNAPGMPKFSHLQRDANDLAFMRYAGGWSAARNPYLRSEVVFYRGVQFVCVVPSTMLVPGDPGVTDWIPVTLLNGRGRMELSAPAIGGTIGPVWSPVTAYDQLGIATPIGCTLDLVAGTFTVSYPGVWRVNFSYFITHDESNQSRQYQARLFNVTDGTATESLPVGIGRNTDATSLNFDFLADIGPDDVGDTYRFEIGNGDTISITTLDYLALDLHQIGA